MYWKYLALSNGAQEIKGTRYGSKESVIEDLLKEQLSVLEINLDYKESIKKIFVSHKLTESTLAVFFKDLNNLLESGMNISQSLTILKETSQSIQLMKIINEIENNFKNGISFSDSIIASKSFPWVALMTLSSAEKVGKLSQAAQMLSVYFQNSFTIKRKIQQAFIYPSIVFSVLIILMLLMSMKIVPQLKSLLPSTALQNPLTQMLLTFSIFLQNYLFYLIAFFSLLIVVIYFLNIRGVIKIDNMIYYLPILGNILKESSLSFYFLNLSVYLSSSISLLKAINDLSLIDSSPVAKHFEKSIQFILGGSAFWESLEQDIFFPKIVSLTLRKAEEVSKLDEYCLSLSKYFQNKVDENVNKITQFLQPFLLFLVGSFLILIAFAFLMPIYGNLTTIAGG